MTDLARRPLVSVITPTFEMASRIGRCIESVKAQTYERIEHIVVDGGSSDGTVDILRTQDHVRWISEPDRGQTDAINKGLRMARGEVLGWLNADDELTSGAIDLVVEALQLSGGGLAYGDIELIDGRTRRRVPPTGPFSVAGMWRGNTISQPGTFWTRQAQELVGELDEDFHLTMDFELWLRFAAAGVTGVYIPEVLARFEVHDSSKTGSVSQLAFVEEEARALRKHGDPHGAAMAVDRWYWNETVRRVGEAALAGRSSEATSTAAAALQRMPGLRARTRLFLLTAVRSPRVAARLYRRSLARSARR